jgi:hypothetical protein
LSSNKVNIPHLNSNINIYTAPAYGISFTTRTYARVGRMHGLCTTSSVYWTINQVEEFVKNLLVFQNDPERYQHLGFKHVLCHLSTDDQRLYWHLDIGSKLTKCLLSCLTFKMWLMLSAIFCRTNVIQDMTTFASQRKSIF